MKTFYHYFIILLSFSVNTACSRCSCAPAEGLRFGLVSFSDAEADTIIIRRYIKGSDFTQRSDTLLVDESKLHFNRSNDTLSHASSTGGAAALHPGYDHEMYFPAINKLVRVSDIHEEPVTQPCGPFAGDKVGCVNPIRSFKLNGQQVTITDGNPLLFVRK